MFSKFLVFLLLGISLADAAVLQISPEGEGISTTAMPVIQFDQPKVPLGKMERTPDQVPVSITPAVPCQWRWLNTTTLSCQLDAAHPLQPATRYTLVVKDDKEYKQTFITERPDILDVNVKTWLSPGTPVIELQLNQEVTAASLNKALVLAAKGKLQEKWPFKLEQSPNNKSFWFLQPTWPLPLDKSFTLKLSPGIQPTIGSEPSISQKELLTFDTFSEFKLLGLRCNNLQGEDVFFKPGEPTGEKRCDPTSFLALVFNAPIEAYKLSQNHFKGQTFEQYLSQRLKPRQQYHLPISSDYADQFGRRLGQAVDILFATDQRRPSLAQPYSQAVLEKAVESDFPVYAVNVKQLNFQYDKLTTKGLEAGLRTTKALSAMPDSIAAVPLGLRQLLPGSGVVLGKLSSEPVLETRPQLFAEVTPYQVQVKLGHFNTVIWVTDLKTGQTVPQAKVSLVWGKGNVLPNLTLPLAAQTTDREGVALLPGLSQLDPRLETFSQWVDLDKKTVLWVSVQKGDDLALLPLTYDFLINNWRISDGKVSEYTREENAHLVVWGMTAQGIYRLGDPIDYKLYARRPTNQNLVLPLKKEYTLEILDPLGKVVEKQVVTFSDFGTYAGHFKTPASGATGWYQFRLSLENKEWLPLSVLVTDFTPAPFKVNNALNSDHFQAGGLVQIATQAAFHAGGPYAHAQVKTTALLQAATFQSADPTLSGFLFNSGTFLQRDSQVVYEGKGQLDEKGEWREQFTLSPTPVVYGKLQVESAVQDDRGKSVAAQSEADYVGVDRLVGLKAKKWVYTVNQPAAVQYVVVDPQGHPQPGTSVNLTIKKEVITSARVQGAGNDYLPVFNTEWKPVSTCEGVSTQAPLDCIFTPNEAGIYQISAQMVDTQGRPHQTALQVWVGGSDYVQWDEPSEAYLPIVPEKNHYRVGDTARYLVKNPYPGAKALITIERYGVIDRFVQTLEGSTPVIQFPIKPNYLPGFYLSVVVFSPRVEKPHSPQADQLDLGKPAFRIGYVSTLVDDPDRQLGVTVQTDKPVYKPGDPVVLKIQAEATHNQPVELAVAVLDESILDLIKGGAGYFDVYHGMYQLESLEVLNYSLLTRLIGRQLFAKKGANPGGDGGSDLSVRRFFKGVAYWAPLVKTNAQGEATIRFTAPDNLTGWRIFALAANTRDRFGTGSAAFKVNRPTEIRPVMPNQVSEGDVFQAGFDVMNRTDQPRTLSVRLEATGTLDPQAFPAQVQQSLSLKPFERQTVWMTVKAGKVSLNQSAQGQISWVAQAGDEKDVDRVSHSVPVLANRSQEVVSAYHSTTDNQATETVAIPQSIATDASHLSVILSPSVLSNLEETMSLLRDYPYTCWEQKLSRAVGAADYARLKGYLPSGFEWKGSEQLTQTILDQAAQFQAPNGGMAYFLAQDLYVDPYLSAYTALAFQTLRAQHYTISPTVEASLQTYLKELLRYDHFPAYYSASMVATVRGMILAVLSGANQLSEADLVRYEPSLTEMGLLGKAYYAQAALSLKSKDLLKKAVTQIKNQAVETSGTVSFNEMKPSGYDRFLATPLRENCAVLDLLTRLGKDPDFVWAQDLPFKLVRTVTQSQKNPTTQEAVFCLNALWDYSQAYESEPPNFTVSVKMGSKSESQTAFHQLQDPAVEQNYPLQASDLGTEQKVTLQRQGEGQLYYTTRLTYAPLIEKNTPVNAGIALERRYSVKQGNSWVPLKASDTLKRGDRVRVDLWVSLPTARSFVVVEDPLPGGLEALNRDLATTASTDWVESDPEASWYFYHQEILQQAVRFYSDAVPKGVYHLAYTAQVIAEGQFTVKPALAKAMYEPDIFGKSAAFQLIVKP